MPEAGTTTYDVIVVGSGAGGATVAREMTRRGHKVLLLERGGRTNWLGNTHSGARIMRRFGLTRSREKHPVTFANNYGGLSNLAAGCAAAPPAKVFDPVGVDLSVEVEEAPREMQIQDLPDELIGSGTLRLLEAANDAGYTWQKLPNFIDPKKSQPNCGACMLGCKSGAKFTARVFGDEAVQKGAKLELRTEVHDVIVEGRRVTGVRGRRWGRPVTYWGKRVVLCAGVDNCHILRRAGITEAGRGFACDWLQFAAGILPQTSTRGDNPMTVGTLEHYEADGIIIVPVFPNRPMFAVMLGMMGLRHLPRLFSHGRHSGVMVKIQDETAGELWRGVAFSKPVTKRDRMRLDKGLGIVRRVLRRAGAADDSFFALPPAGAHPSATCRIGEVVDKNLETELGGLYCCDASVFPTSLGLPVVWTAVALGKRLAKHLAAELN